MGRFNAHWEQGATADQKPLLISSCLSVLSLISLSRGHPQLTFSLLVSQPSDQVLITICFHVLLFSSPTPSGRPSWGDFPLLVLSFLPGLFFVLFCFLCGSHSFSKQLPSFYPFQSYPNPCPLTPLKPFQISNLPLKNQKSGSHWA